MESSSTPRLTLTDEQKFHLISQVATEGLMIHEKGIVHYVNEYLADTLGYTADELIGRNGFELIAPEYREQVTEWGSGDADRHYRTILLTKDGPGKHMELAARTADVGGRQLRVVVFRDLTDRITTEIENERLRTIVETNPDFIGMAAPDGTALYVNPAGLAMCGYESWEGLNIKQFQPDLPAEYLQEAVDFGSWVGEAYLTSRDGDTIPVSQVITSIKDSDGNVVSFTNISRDISEQKEMEEQLMEQNQLMSEMSTPVIKLWDRIVLMPLIGVIDSDRATQMIEILLQAVVEDEAIVAVVDVTGVPVIDTSIARHLLKTIDAAAMLGAHVIVTGFSPDAAQTLAQLGVDFSAMRTSSTLSDGIEEAFRLVGAEVIAD